MFLKVTPDLRMHKEMNVCLMIFCEAKLRFFSFTGSSSKNVDKLNLVVREVNETSKA